MSSLLFQIIVIPAHYAGQGSLMCLGLLSGKQHSRIWRCWLLLEASGADLVVLAGYLQKVGKQTLKAYRGRIINTHPSLLPRHGGKGMYGSRVHKAVLDSGDTETGVTIHHVTDEYDSGAIIAQYVVPVMIGDTVASIEERVKKAEKQLICNVIQMFGDNYPIRSATTIVGAD